MLKFKNDNVSAQSLSSQLLLVLFVATEAYRVNGFDCIVTSLNDSRHSKTSLHYSGNGGDLRIKGIPPSIVGKIHAQIVDSLNQDYDVILEPNHIHIEYQPKRRRWWFS